MGGGWVVDGWWMGGALLMIYNHPEVDRIWG